MYEIWLAMNIVWEMALGIMPLLLVGAVTWAVLMTVALRRRAEWGRALPGALLAGAAVTVLLMLMLPGWTQSSLREMGYWVDWANLVAMSAGFGALAAAFAWPLLAMRRRGAPAGSSQSASPQPERVQRA
jgi:hypothetical protein